MSFGKVIEFFHRAAESDPEELPAPEGNERVRELIGLPEHVLFRPRVEVREKAPEAPRRRIDHPRDKRTHDDEHREEDVDRKPPEEEDSHDLCGDHDGGAQVGLLNEQKGKEQHHRGHREKARQKRVHVVLFLHRKGGCEDECSHLHHFGNLQIHEAERDPASGTVHGFAEPRDEDRNEDEHRQHADRHRPAKPEAHRYAIDDERADRRKADA